MSVENLFKVGQNQIWPDHPHLYVAWILLMHIGINCLPVGQDE